MSLISPVIIPDRYEVLSRSSEVSTIVVPIDEALKEIDSIFSTMRVAKRGAFAVLRGRSGAGKSTFLHTISLYREGVRTVSIEGQVNIKSYFDSVKISSSTQLQIFVLEEREAATSFSDEELETWLHAINAFIRSPSGVNSLIVWPCNSDSLMNRLTRISIEIGGRALLGAVTPNAHPAEARVGG